MRIRGILDRLRPAGAPGEATRAGVPVDRLESLRGELAPVFAQLEPVLRECARITQEATAEARRRESDAAGQAQAIVAKAQAESEAERAEAGAAAGATADRETEHVLADAYERAQEVRRRGEQLRPQRVARVLDLVRAEVHAFADNAAGQGAGSA